MKLFLCFGFFWSFHSLLGVANQQGAFNARYAGMAGTNLAFGGSPLDLATNPANLRASKEKNLEINGTVPFINVQYSDQFLNSKDISNSYSNNKRFEDSFLLPSFGFSTPLTSSLHFGTAAYIESGGKTNFDGIIRNSFTGGSFNSLANANIPGAVGNTTLVSESIQAFSYTIKWSNGISYSLGNWDFGIAVSLGASKAKSSTTYKDITGTLPITNQGFQYESALAFAPGINLGINYTFENQLKFAIVYTSKERYYLDGKMKLISNDANFFFPLRTSTYSENPENMGVGVSKRWNAVLVGFDLSYYFFSKSNDSQTFIFDRQAFPTFAGPTSAFRNTQNFRDTYKTSIGMEYSFSETFTCRAGHTYNPNPVSSSGLNPFFGGLIYENISALGFTQKFEGSWAFHGAFNYLHLNQLSGTSSSDWALQHSVFNQNNIQLQNFSYSVSSSVYAITFGLNKTW